MTTPGEQHWFICLSDKRYGPYPFAALVDAADNGQIGTDTLVWRLGWLEWHPASQVPGLIDAERVRRRAGVDPPSTGSDQFGSDQTDLQPPVATAQMRDGDASPPANSKPEAPAPVSAVAPAPAYIDFEREVDGQPDAPAKARMSPVTPDKPEPEKVEPKQAEPEKAVPEKAAAENVPDVVKSPAAPSPGLGSLLSLRPGLVRSLGTLLPQTAAAPSVQKADARNGAADPAATVVEVTAPIVAPVSDATKAQSNPKPRSRPARDDNAPTVPVVAGVPKARRPRVKYVGWVVGISFLLLIGLVIGLFWTGVVHVVDEDGDSQTSGITAQDTPPSATTATTGTAAATMSTPARVAQAPLGELPLSVTSIPAVAALATGDPTSFARFRKRFLRDAGSVPEAQYASLARSTLRKSLKRQLANAVPEMLVEMTAVYLGYMEALQFSNPESCVALSDENKGARLTMDLANEFPTLFARDMAVLTRIAAGDPTKKVAVIGNDQAQPYLESVFEDLRKQPVQLDLLARDKLTKTDFLPYCTLIIAFYEKVLSLNGNRRIDLLRYLYAAAVADADDDVK